MPEDAQRRTQAVKADAVTTAHAAGIDATRTAPPAPIQGLAIAATKAVAVEEPPRGAALLPTACGGVQGAAATGSLLAPGATEAFPAGACR